ncbi:hypothetical protein LguiA_004161 [Lonicera macranthoides]
MVFFCCEWTFENENGKQDGSLMLYENGKQDGSLMPYENRKQDGSLMQDNGHLKTKMTMDI